MHEGVGLELGVMQTAAIEWAWGEECGQEGKGGFVLG